MVRYNEVWHGEVRYIALTGIPHCQCTLQGHFLILPTAVVLLPVPDLFTVHIP